MWEIVSEDPVRWQRLTRALSAIGKGKGYEPQLLLEGYDWESIGRGVVVDVGGSDGSMAVLIAKRFPQLNCVVQDLAALVEEGKSKLPADLFDRVKFMS